MDGMGMDYKPINQLQKDTTSIFSTTSRPFFLIRSQTSAMEAARLARFKGKALQISKKDKFSIKTREHLSNTTYKQDVTDIT